MQLTKELFVIPDDGNYILYAPLKGSVMLVNNGVVNLLQEIERGETPEKNETLDELVSEGIVVDKEESLIITVPEEFAPTSVTLFPTTDCNLRCIYCYSSAGEEKVNMDWDVAKAAIDLVVDNTLKNEENKVRINFHGGGESISVNFDLVKRSADYLREIAEKNGLASRVASSTNGVMNEKQAVWVAENLDSVSLSFDGPEEIQNKQRPAKNSSGSYETVLTTTQIWNSLGKPFSIRSTITRDSCSQMEEILYFFANEIGAKRVHVEPLHGWGRSGVSRVSPPNPIYFVNEFLRLKKKANEIGVDFVTSGLKDTILDRYCGAYGKSFVVNSDGLVSSCLVRMEECSSDDSYFVYGKFNFEERRFLFDQEKIVALGNRNVTSNSYCSDCFVKYNCGGGCLARADIVGEEHRPSEYKCQVTKALMVDKLKKSLKK